MAILKVRRRERIWARRGPTRTRAEVRSESEDEVRANLSPDELIVWEQVKGRIKPTQRMSRTEAFSHWVHEHPEEVSRLLEKQVAKELKELEREVEREQRRFKEGVSKASDKELEQRIRESIAPKAPEALPTWLPVLPPEDEEEGALALALYLETVHDHAKILPELQRVDDATFARVLRQKTPEGIADNRRYLAERVRDYFFGGNPEAAKEWVRRADLASGGRTPAPAQQIGRATERLAKRGAQKARKNARARADEALVTQRELDEVDLPKKLLAALARARRVRDQVAAGEADVKAWDKAIANAYRVHNKVVWDEYRDTQHRDEGLDAIADLIRESDVRAAASDARQRARKAELERLREEEREEKAGTTEYVPGIGYVTHPARKREPVPF